MRILVYGTGTSTGGTYALESSFQRMTLLRSSVAMPTRKTAVKKHARTYGNLAINCLNFLLIRGVIISKILRYSTVVNLAKKNTYGTNKTCQKYGTVPYLIFRRILSQLTSLSLINSNQFFLLVIFFLHFFSLVPYDT